MVVSVSEADEPTYAIPGGRSVTSSGPEQARNVSTDRMWLQCCEKGFDDHVYLTVRLLKQWLQFKMGRNGTYSKKRLNTASTC